MTYDWKRDFKPEGMCYVLPQGLMYHPVIRAIRDNHSGACYPESGMSRIEKVTCNGFIPTIVTEEPYLIALYDREKVRVYEEGVWRSPDIQTYGSDVSHIDRIMLDIRYTVPYRVISNEAADELIETTKERYVYTE